MVERVARKRPPRPAADQHEATLSVSASPYGTEGTTRREVLSVHKFEVEPAYVRISAGTTKKLADYESLRVDVSISVPCYTEEIEAVAKKVGEKVSEILSAELAEYGIDVDN